VDCTYIEVSRFYADNEYIPIGKACRNMQVLVLKEDDTEANTGEVGELCVRGSGVALGYYGNRAKTDEVFVQNPLNLLYNDIIYRTGDLVRPDEEGNLIFVSRKDFQVKHKGNRIELGEIEVAVNSIEGVTNAACIFDQENDKLVLYYTTADGKLLDIINLVKERIPVYMFPEVINHLSNMPYNLNGKIDRITLKRHYDESRQD
jgi:acyl-coenzyme A synthetase/AMP-(fatty) acid ligase